MASSARRVLKQTSNTTNVTNTAAVVNPIQKSENYGQERGRSAHRSLLCLAPVLDCLQHRLLFPSCSTSTPLLPLSDTSPIQEPFSLRHVRVVSVRIEFSLFLVMYGLLCVPTRLTTKMSYCYCIRLGPLFSTRCSKCDILGNRGSPNAEQSVLIELASRKSKMLNFEWARCPGGQARVDCTL